jgi:ketosteroid isomerase-like protein
VKSLTRNRQAVGRRPGATDRRSLDMGSDPVLATYEQLVASFREGRWDEKFSYFAPDATIVDGGRFFGSLDDYRSAWNRWAAQHDELPVPASVETTVLKLQVFGDVAVLTHAIDSREEMDSTEMEREIETIVFAQQPDGPWRIVHQNIGSRAD